MGIKFEIDGTYLKFFTKRERSVIITLMLSACAMLLSIWLTSTFITAKYTARQLTFQV